MRRLREAWIWLQGADRLPGVVLDKGSLDNRSNKDSRNCGRHDPISRQTVLVAL